MFRSTIFFTLVIILYLGNKPAFCKRYFKTSFIDKPYNMETYIGGYFNLGIGKTSIEDFENFFTYIKDENEIDSTMGQYPKYIISGKVELQSPTSGIEFEIFNKGMSRDIGGSNEYRQNDQYYQVSIHTRNLVYKGVSFGVLGGFIYKEVNSINYYEIPDPGNPGNILAIYDSVKLERSSGVKGAIGLGIRFLNVYLQSETGLRYVKDMENDKYSTDFDGKYTIELPLSFSIFGKPFWIKPYIFLDFNFFEDNPGTGLVIFETERWSFDASFSSNRNCASMLYNILDFWSVEAGVEFDKEADELFLLASVSISFSGFGFPDFDFGSKK